MDRDKIPQWITSLEIEDISFIKNFIVHSGSLKEIAKIYDVSYPTVRLRLDKLIQKIEISDKQESEPFTIFISKLAIDSKLDLDTAKQIIDYYKKEKQEE
ncbi:DUF2089 domain-containing protein [Paenibacillus sp. ACRRX]|uniref:DUF2089 family protein n=1 Tax=Paenibacillus sp. ACRRX TaxID=2918206 RepID=UPI001EF6ED43|nr:DUF2089 family protein [Paenibacillus sp. ACRRX]MCG7406606.1 DUF2089 domain-containing protein [Paenibacillus sp. ACRRX]